MSLLCTRKRENTGMSDHEYATRFGWTVEIHLSADDYLQASERFETLKELETLALKCFRGSVRFRRSKIGRLLAWLARISQEGTGGKEGKTDG